MMHTLWLEWYRLPGLLRIGLVVFAAGSGLDLAFHAARPAWAPYLASMLGADGQRGHLMIMAGMALIVFGLIAEGMRQGSRGVKEAPAPGRR